MNVTRSRQSLRRGKEEKMSNLTVLDVVKKFAMGAGVFSRDEIEVVLNCLLEYGALEDEDEVSADNND